MSAVNVAVDPTSLDAERRAHEPSMEEILASIRRIIADDEALPAARAERRAAHEPPPLRGAEPPVIAPAPAREPAEFWSRARRPAGELSEPVRETAPEAPQADDESRWTLDASQEADAAEELDEPLEDDAYESYGVAEEAEAEAAFDLDEEAPPEPAVAAPEAAAPLVSPDAAQSIASHFQALAASIVISEADLIERYARDLLRPMLKQWLDENLPSIVERLVRAEIERVARGRR